MHGQVNRLKVIIYNNTYTLRFNEICSQNQVVRRIELLPMCTDFCPKRQNCRDSSLVVTHSTSNPDAVRIFSSQWVDCCVRMCIYPALAALVTHNREIQQRRCTEIVDCSLTLAMILVIRDIPIAPRT